MNDTHAAPVPGMTAEEETALIRRAKSRQEELVERLRGFGALGGEYRLDLSRGVFFWIDADGVVRAVARAKALCCYWLPKFRMTPAWAAPELADGAVVERVEGEPDEIRPCDQRTAWITAARLAEAVGADWFYRAPDEDRWLYLAFWDVRAAREGEAFLPGTSREYVDDVTAVIERTLAGGGDDVVTLRKLVRSHAASLDTLAQEEHRISADRARFRECAVRLRAVADGLPRWRLGLLPPRPLEDAERTAIVEALVDVRAVWRE